MLLHLYVGPSDFVQHFLTYCPLLCLILASLGIAICQDLSVQHGTRRHSCLPYTQAQHKPCAIERLSWGQSQRRSETSRVHCDTKQQGCLADVNLVVLCHCKCNKIPFFCLLNIYYETINIKKLYMTTVSDMHLLQFSCVHSTVESIVKSHRTQQNYSRMVPDSGYSESRCLLQATALRTQHCRSAEAHCLCQMHFGLYRQPILGYTDSPAVILSTQRESGNSLGRP